MKILTSIVLLIFVLLFVACKKETESDSKIISKKIQEVIRNENIVRVIPTRDYPPGSGVITYDPAYGKTYEFSPPFIVIGSTNYNLGNLKSYYISFIESDKSLFLVF